MRWAKYNVGWYRDPKVAALSWQAELLYVRAIAFAADQLSDGVIVADALPLLGAKIKDVDAAAAELVAAKLWLVTPGSRSGHTQSGYKFPPRTWRKYQLSRSDVEQQRANAAARQRKHRAKRNAVTSASPDDVSRVTNASVTELEEERRDGRERSLSTPEPQSAARNGAADDPRIISETFSAMFPEREL